MPLAHRQGEANGFHEPVCEPGQLVARTTLDLASGDRPAVNAYAPYPYAHPFTLSSLFVLIRRSGSPDVDALECSSAPKPGAAASIGAEAVEAIVIRGGDVRIWL